MTRYHYSRLESSQAIDELLSLSDRRHPPNWLLTYIDVFVLIVMLVVTLVSLSSFETDRDQSKHPAQTLKTSHFPEIDATLSPETNEKPTARHRDEKTALSPQSKPVVAEANKVEQETETSGVLMQPSPNAMTTEQPKQKQERAEAEPSNGQPANSNHAIAPEPEPQQQFHQQFAQLGLNDSINMNVTQGYAQLEIQDNILYHSSEAELTESGRSVLTRLAPLLKQTRGLIYIEGHTDDRPIKTVRFPSNWELGAARATSVLHFLTSQQIDAGRMRAVTYADTQPIADNATDQGRQRNRRVNIVIKLADEYE